MSSHWVEWAVRDAAAVKIGALKVTPQAFSLRVQWPGGGAVWNHPASFTVENVENAGATQRVPIVDVLWMARLAFLALLGLWLLGLTVSARLGKKENAS